MCSFGGGHAELRGRQNAGEWARAGGGDAADSARRPCDGPGSATDEDDAGLPGCRVQDAGLPARGACIKSIGLSERWLRQWLSTDATAREMHSHARGQMGFDVGAHAARAPCECELRI